jgi:hypothetical protein
MTEITMRETRFALYEASRPSLDGGCDALKSLLMGTRRARATRVSPSG